MENKYVGKYPIKIRIHLRPAGNIGSRLWEIADKYPEVDIKINNGEYSYWV